jgi:hypothetical protein
MRTKAFVAAEIRLDDDDVGVLAQLEEDLHV